ncbi:hypothetical protein ['Chrysanthemum coronarium' phytoplasma]|uniref:hypothetical protein n=1 Tax='Chrysanthemum coronarium' phytoplasma TaxID=1520703 RepID=UPI0011D041BB|nr:hypothetical protein ['Chrysanthemum coronarium' phytoplasma]
MNVFKNDKNLNLFYHRLLFLGIYQTTNIYALPTPYTFYNAVTLLTMAKASISLIIIIPKMNYKP